MLDKKIPTGFNDEIDFNDESGYHVFRTTSSYFWDDFRPVEVVFELEGLTPHIDTVRLGSRPDSAGRITWTVVTDSLYDHQIEQIGEEIEAAVRLSISRSMDDKAAALADDYF